MEIAFDICQDCKQPIAEPSLSYWHCQDCWEKYCSAEWWKVVGAIEQQEVV